MPHYTNNELDAPLHLVTVTINSCEKVQHKFVEALCPIFSIIRKCEKAHKGLLPPSEHKRFAIIIEPITTSK